MNTPHKRSNAPIFWLLFGAGGMLSALLGPVLVFITGLAVPLGLLLPADLLRHDRVLAFARSLPGMGLLFIVVSLFAWHAVHRIFHSLHDLGLKTGLAAKLLCYGTAAVLTLVALLSLAALNR